MNEYIHVYLSVCDVYVGDGDGDEGQGVHHGPLQAQPRQHGVRSTQGYSHLRSR